MSNTKGHAAIFAACVFLADRAQARDVVLRPLTDAAEQTVTGQLLGFDGQFIRIATDLGELTVDYTKVSCDGTACPDINTFVPAIRLSGAPPTGRSDPVPADRGICAGA